MTDNNNNMELSERMDWSHQLPADEGVILLESLGQTPRNQPTQSHHSASSDLRQPGLTTDECELQQQPGADSLQLEFQDSTLSPALPLLPARAGVEHNFTDYSFSHHSVNEFATLSAYPDISVASQRMAQASECGSLSQHSLTQPTVLSEERSSSCCSLSQHSLSPEAESQLKGISHSSADERGASSTVDTGSGEKELESAGKLFGKAGEDETVFLSKDIPAQQRLLKSLQKDIGMLSSGSAISSTSGMSARSIVSLIRESDVCNPGTDQSMLRREGSPGESSLSHQQTQRPSQTLSSEVCNVTTGSRSPQPDDNTEASHTELLAEAERNGKREAQSKNRPRSLTPNPTETSEGTLGVTGKTPGSVPWTCAFTAGLIQVHQEQDHSSLGGHAGIDGSYLGFLPQSQSTPGVFKATPKSSVQTKLGQLSVVESDKENSNSPQPADPVAEGGEEAPSAKVQSLPCLNYMQKVDAWRANQSSGKTSLFHSLALQGFPGVSSKKKAYDAAPDALSHALRQQVRSVQQPPAASAANQTGTETSSIVPSPRNEEAVGSAPTVSVARTSASPFGRSQSHSSLSTVVVLGQKDPKTTSPEKVNSSIVDDVEQPSTSVQVSPLKTLGQFSDVALSSSQDSYNSGVKLGASMGASSITSLEVDNYTPFWTSKLSTPPPQARHQELNIEERIPLYLHNLGIHQSPSTILTPFVPRGPIREPEFSPTELCTIRGSIGTPTKSAQPSEGSSPHKAEFSRSSILSVDSSISIPLCLDSLGPAVSFPDQALIPAPSDVQTARGRPCSSQPDGDRRVSVPRHGNQQPKGRRLISNQDVVQPRHRLDSDVSSGGQSSCGERNAESAVQTSRSLNPSAEGCFVKSQAVRETHRLVVSTGSCAESTSTAAALPRLLSDSDGFASLTKTSRVQNSSFSSSSAAEEARTQSSFLDSVLTSEKQRQSLVLSKPARRTEPEGCSAVPVDGKAPTQPAVVKPLPPVSIEHLLPAPPHTVGAPEEQDREIGNPAHGGSPSLTVADVDQAAVSDGGSESSLAVAAAKMLRSESPSTAMSSSNSVANHEESEARGWQQYESVLDQEVRQQIEMMKMKKNLLTSQESTDTESIDSNSVGVPLTQDPPQPAEAFIAFSHVPNNRLMRGFSTALHQSSTQLLHPSSPDLEARVQNIAVRAGVALPRTSVTVASWKRSASSSLPTSPAPSLSPAVEPLHLSELSTGSAPHLKATKHFSPSQDEDGNAARETAVVRDPSGVKIQNPNSQSGVDQDSVGGQLEENPPHSAMVHDGKQSPGLTPSESPSRTGDVTRVCFTLSPKASDHRQTTDVKEPRSTLVLPRPGSAAASSPQQRVAVSSPPQWFNTRGQIRSEGLERSDSPTLFKPTVPQGASRQTGHLDTASAAVPVLLPYKPRGSEELFYIPQMEADVSSAGPSDTTMESSHTGSDDAVPPRFSSDVLGLPNPGLDRGVFIRHTEGIYSKRGIMQQAKHREASVAADRSGSSEIQVPKPFPQVSSASSGAPTRNQGTSPDQRFSYSPADTSSKMDYEEQIQQSREAGVHQQRSLDQLWQSFCRLWSLDESQPTAEREASMLERLERLSRLIHNTRAAALPEQGEEAKNQKQAETETDVWGSGRMDEGLPSHTWTQKLQRDDSHASCTSSLSHSSFQSQHLCPADRDETGSMSTIDTSRLIRAFGARRVQHPKSSHSLSKLYSSISKQKDGGRQKISPQSETTATDESVAADSTSSTSTYTLPSHRGPSRSLAVRKAVKLVSKGVQAGDLEIVSNGTRHHTRDVGTTFPSPGGETRAVRPLSPSLSSAGVSSLSKSRRASRRSPAKPRPEGVCWFISAEELRSDVRKENQPTDESSAWRPSTAWFEPYGSRPPWREPLRERQVHHERNPQPTSFSPAEPDPEPRTKTLSPGGPRVSLQEALEMRRPEFISQSRQRMRRLALQVEERKLQPLFSGEEDEFFRESGLRRRPNPGPALHRRAVPRKEMIQRSRQIYENLPEVQRRREEEKRKAEYRSYRLNAKLYNKRITNRVLGRRSGWT